MIDLGRRYGEAVARIGTLPERSGQRGAGMKGIPQGQRPRSLEEGRASDKAETEVTVPR